MRAFKALVVFTIVISLFINFSFSTQADGVSNSDEHWLGIYSDQDRVGYSYYSIDESGDKTNVEEITKLTVNLLGNDMDVYTEGTYLLEGYRIINFAYEMSSEKIKLKAWGKREGDKLVITMQSASGNSERSIQVEEELILPSLVPKLLFEKGLKEGLTMDVPLFEPLMLLMGMKDTKSANRVQGIETVETSSGRYKAYKVQSSSMGVESTSWISEDGELIKQTTPPGLTAIRETKKEIFSKNNSSFNIIEKTSIPVAKTLDDPQGLNYLKVKLQGIDTDDLKIHDGYRQFVDGGFVEVKSDVPDADIKIYNLPYEYKEFREYTEPDFLVQSDDAEIITITEKIVAGERDPKLAAKKINSWIYKNLKKSATVSLPNAKDVLETRVGDCNEHAALFTAMARAAGIPTKTVLGVMYYEDSFYYHAWNEVFIGKWVAVDSTYGQFPADATHLKLIEGNLAKSGEISKVVGKLNIEIIDAS